MLVLKRNEGGWVEITHWSGDVIRVSVTKIRSDPRPSAYLVFEDDAHLFTIHREENPRRRFRHGQEEMRLRQGG